MTLVDHGERGPTLVVNSTIRSLAGMSLSMILAEDLCATMRALTNQRCSNDLCKMGILSHLQRFKPTERVRMVGMVVVEPLPMPVEAAETSLDA